MPAQPKKRKRLPLSCDNCRKKKAKCDRNFPCSNCIKLSISHTCIYSSPDHINHTKSVTSVFNNESLPVHKTSSSVHSELYLLKSRLNDLETSITNTPVQPRLLYSSDGLSQADIFIESDNGLAKSNKDLLVNILPYDSEDETINFYFSEEDGSRVSRQPLPFIFLLKRDPGAKFFWLIKKERKTKTNIKEIYQFMNRTGELEEMKQMAKVKFGGRYIKALEDGYSIQDVKESLSIYGKELGLSFHTADISELSLEQKIAAIIPDLVASCKYLTSFFEYLYPFFPIVDEMSFRSDLTRILGDLADGSVNKTLIHIEKRTDHAVLSSYLYIIRLTYLLWFTNDKKYKYGLPGDVSLSYSRERQVAMDNPVPLEAATLAQECIDQCNLTRKPQLAVLQALIFSRVYDKFAPEIGEKFKGQETQLLDGIIMNLAIALNLNRDPDYALEKQEDNMKNLKRKIWHTILFIDLIDTMIYGTTLSADRDHNYDMKIPYYKEGNENIVDVQLEKDVIKSIACFRPLILSMDRIAKRLFDVKQRVKISIILDEIRDLEMLTVRIFGRFKCFLKPDFSNSDSFVIQEMYYYLNIKAFLVTIYFYFHIHFHEKGNPDLEFFYHKKVFTTLFYELAELSNLQTSVNNRTFGRAVTLILSPVISRIDHISCMVASSFCVRLTATLRQRMETIDSQNAQFTSKELAQDLLQMSLISARNSLARLSTTSIRYFHSWKINKVHLFGINLVRETLMYECSNSSVTKCAKFNYTNQQLREIEKLLRRYTLIYCVSNKVSANLDSQNEPNCGVSHEVMSADLDVLDSYHILSPDSIDSLDPRVKDEDTVLDDLQMDNFWVQLIKVHSDNDESCKSEQNNVDGSIEIPKLGPDANDGNLIDSTNYEISSDNLFYELFDIANIT